MEEGKGGGRGMVEGEKWQRERNGGGRGMAEGEEWWRERTGGGRGMAEGEEWRGQKEEEEEGILSIRRHDPIEVSRVSLP